MDGSLPRRRCALLALALLLIPTSAVAQDQPDPDALQASIVNGVPAQSLDTWVDGDLALRDLEPGTVSAPVDLGPGPHVFEFTASGAAGAQPLMMFDRTMPSGTNLSLVAHLSQDGAPTTSAFANDVSPIDTGMARLVLRHLAALPPADVLVDGEPATTDLANATQATLNLPAGTHDLAVVPTGGGDAVAQVSAAVLPSGTSTIVYVVGSGDDDTVVALVQQIDGLGEPPAEIPPGDDPTPAMAPPEATEPVVPTGIPAGEAGLADRAPTTALVLALLGLMALAAAARRPSSPRR